MKRFIIVLTLLVVFGGVTYWLGRQAGAQGESTQRQESLAATVEPEAEAAATTYEEVGDDAPDGEEVKETSTFTPQSIPTLDVSDVPMLARMNKHYTTLVDAVLPSVVNIQTTREVSQAELMERGFRMPFGGPPEGEQGGPPLTAFGSGVIISHEGHIVTNAHVVKGAETIEVETADENQYEAEVVGYDEPADIAVIKIKGDGLKPLMWGDSEALQVGEIVFAIGNPLGQANSVSHGIVSALGRNPQISGYEDFIQTNAAINPGNSGGALVNIRGELIGINTAIASTTQGFQGIGFAIPSNHARFAMDSLITSGRVVRGWLGVGISTIEPEWAAFFNLEDGDGVLVNSVGAGTPAEKAGVRPQDIILTFDEEKVDSPEELRLVVSQTPVGKTVDMDVMRAGGAKTLKVTVTEQLPNSAAMRLFQSEPEEAEEEPKRPENVASDESLLGGIAVVEIDAQTRRQWKLPRGTKGVVVEAIDRTSPAAAAGMREGDVIQTVRFSNGESKRVADVPTFLAIANGQTGGESVLLLVCRGKSFPMPMLIEPSAAGGVIP